MHIYTLKALVFGVVLLFLSLSNTRASVLSCPPSNMEVPPGLRHICNLLENAVKEQRESEDYGKLDERSLAGYNSVNAKRQDVDHVFLRFGRPYNY